MPRRDLEAVLGRHAHGVQGCVGHYPAGLLPWFPKKALKLEISLFLVNLTHFTMIVLLSAGALLGLYCVGMFRVCYISKIPSPQGSCFDSLEKRRDWKIALFLSKRVMWPSSWYSLSVVSRKHFEAIRRRSVRLVPSVFAAYPTHLPSWSCRKAVKLKNAPCMCKGVYIERSIITPKTRAKAFWEDSWPAYGICYPHTRDKWFHSDSCSFHANERLQKVLFSLKKWPKKTTKKVEHHFSFSQRSTCVTSWQVILKLQVICQLKPA